MRLCEAKKVLMISFWLLLGLSTLNAQNPYEGIGQIHNSGLDYLIQKKNLWFKGDKTTDEPILMQLTVQFFTEEAKKSFGSNLDVDGLEANVMEALNSISKLFKEKKDFKVIIATQEMSPSARSFIEELLNVDGEYNSMLASINSIESRIIQSTFEDKDVCLMASSVLKHSYSYWYLAAQDSGNPWGEVIYKIDWKAIGKADVTGAVIGGIRGAITGVTSGALVMGPGGIVLTTAGGVVAGALWASAGTAAIWSWW